MTLADLPPPNNDAELLLRLKNPDRSRWEECNAEARAADRTTTRTLVSACLKNLAQGNAKIFRDSTHFSGNQVAEGTHMGLTRGSGPSILHFVCECVYFAKKNLVPVVMHFTIVQCGAEPRSRFSEWLDEREAELSGETLGTIFSAIEASFASHSDAQLLLEWHALTTEADLMEMVVRTKAPPILLGDVARALRKKGRKMGFGDAAVVHVLIRCMQWSC